MRSLLLVLPFVLIAALLHAKPLPPDKKEPPAPPFKPIDIKNVLEETDPKDEKLNFPSRKFNVKLQKDKSYVIDMVSTDFDTYLRLLDKKGRQLAEDDDGGGDLNSRIIASPSESGDHTVVATTFDGKVGNFTLKVRELNLKGEAEPREVKNGSLDINGSIGQNDATDLDKLSKLHTVGLKAGKMYLVEVKTDDFDPQVYVFNSKGKLLGQDMDKVVCVSAADGSHHIVVKSFDSQLGKFELSVREFALKGEAKARDVGKDGLSIAGNIGANDTTPIGKLGKVYSVNLKAGQEYTLDLEGQNLDCFLYLFDMKSGIVVRDDDSAAPNARIVFRASSDGVHHILATSFDGTETGEFTLKVRKN